MEKETLEEVIRNNGYHDQSSDAIWREGVHFGSKWQQEQDKNKYSELSLFLEKEADKDRLHSLTSNQIRTLIEKFKKK